MVGRTERKAVGYPEEVSLKRPAVGKDCVAGSNPAPTNQK